MRALAINSMFANAVYRRCADELGSIPGVELTMLTVDEWRMNDRVMPLDPITVGSPYRTIVGRAGWRGYENRGFYRSGVIRALRASKPEVVFLMEEPFSVFALEVLAARQMVVPNVPVVFFTWNNLSLTEFDYRPSVFYRNVAKRTLPRMQYALTANSDGVDVLRRAGFDRPIKVVGYGVDTTAYSEDRGAEARAIRDSLGIDRADTVIGYVGRILEMKGLDLLIDAVSQVRSRHAKAKLLLVGSGEFESELKARAKSAGVDDILRHVSVVPHKQVPAYMQAMDILVLPSRRVKMWAEQFGRVLVEGMASGRIVIGSTSGAIPEVIGDAGFVFRENDALDLAAVLEKALRLSESERSELARRARTRAAEVYSWKRFARDAYEAMNHSLETFGRRP
jgi:glycosyltransferase involved in cell wall biosynthesis